MTKATRTNASAQAQARLGDLWIPQRGIFAIGRTFFKPFDEARHVSVTSQMEAA